ncbi:hypothetical protein ACHAO8_010143 [Botrytis cinerea]
MPITQQREVYINIKKTPLEHGAILYGNVSLSAMDDLPLDDDDDDDDDAFDKQRNIPSQQLLKSVLGDKMSDEKYAEGVSSIRETAKTNGIDKTMYQHGLDVIIGLMNGRILTIAVAA